MGEEVGLGGKRVGLMQLHQEPGLPPHVVRLGRYRPLWRAPEDALPVPDFYEIREVRGARGELPDLHLLGLGEAFYVLLDVPLDGGAIEVLVLAHLYRLLGQAYSPPGSTIPYGVCISSLPN